MLSPPAISFIRVLATTPRPPDFFIPARRYIASSIALSHDTGHDLGLTITDIHFNDLLAMLLKARAGLSAATPCF